MLSNCYNISVTYVSKCLLQFLQEKNEVLIHHQYLHFDNVNDSYTLTFELMVSTTCTLAI